MFPGATNFYDFLIENNKNNVGQERCIFGMLQPHLW